MAAPRYDFGIVDSAPLGRRLEFPISRRIAKNRLLKAPMAEGLATWSYKNVDQRGVPTPELVELYRIWGQGERNWGVIVTGNIDIDTSMLGTPGHMAITQDCPTEGERFDKFKEIASVAKSNGSLIMGQVVHPGRQVHAILSPTAISASDAQLSPKMGMAIGAPHAATKDEIESIVNGFAYAAVYLEKAGFDGMEVHAAHGYLVAQFLSRTTNRRSDEYGVQNVENRMRFFSDVVRAIKARVSPNFIVAAKLNSVEFQEGGVTAGEAKEVIEVLEKLGVDYVQLSGGTYENVGINFKRDSTKIREGFFLEFAKTISEAFGKNRKLKMYIAGGMRSVPAMVEALDIVDVVALARPAAAEPRLASDILEGQVQGSIKPLRKIGDDISFSMVVAGAQIWQIAKGKEPFAMGDDESISHLEKDIAVWVEEKVNDGEELEHVKPVSFTRPEIPYGTVSYSLKGKGPSQERIYMIDTRCT